MQKVIFGVVTVVVIGLIFGIFQSFELKSAKPELTDMNDYELGEYYFNHDEDPAGPYDLEKARFHYEQVIAADPQGNAVVWHQLGRIDFLEGDFEAALEKFDKQVEYFNTAVPNVYYMIGLTHAYRARNTKDVADWYYAEKAFTEFLRHDPTNPWARTDLSWIYFAQGKYPQMHLVLELGLEHNPDHPWLLNMFGLALRNLGEPEEAKVYFDRAVAEGEKLTVEDWGRAYPGNSPTHWSDGLDEFKFVLNYNAALE